MKKILLLLLLLLLLSGCNNIKSYEESLLIFENEGYEIEEVTNGEFLGVKNVNRLVVTDGLKIGTIYYCESKEDAKTLYNFLYNIYLRYIYNGSQYGFNNLINLKYGLEQTSIYYLEYYTEVDEDLLTPFNNSFLEMYLFGSIESFLIFPNIYLPDTYEEFKSNQDFYTPECILEGNNIYFGSKEILQKIIENI